MAWCGETTKGWRYGIVSDEGLGLYEKNGSVDLETEIEDEVADMTGEDKGREFPEFARVYLGKKLAEVSTEQINETLDAAHRLDASAALDLLLRKSGIDDVVVATSALYVEPSKDAPYSSRWMAYVRDRFFMLHAVEGSARLAESENQAGLIEVSREEISVHRNSLI
jgi:hypothetical protein